jgi:hypothetical protein
MKRLFEVGDCVYGYCGGHFGRDSYSDKICILSTDNYAVFHCIDTETAEVFNYAHEGNISEEMLAEWKNKENSYNSF